MKTVCISNLDEIAEVLKVLSVPYRLQIVCLLDKNDELCVCDIVKYLGIKQNLVSHHLGMLKRIQLIWSKRNGLNQIYFLNESKYNKIKESLRILFGL